MGDFAPLASLGGAAIPTRANTDPQAVAIAPVAASSKGRGPQARMDTAPQISRPDTRDRSEADRAHPFSGTEKFDDFTLVGPTPAFQANVLELERDLQRAIERLEAERGRVEAEAAIKIERAEARADAAEADTSKVESSARMEVPENTVPDGQTVEEVEASPIEVMADEPPETRDAPTPENGS